MSRKWTIILTALVASVIGVIVAFLVFTSPEHTLRFALMLDRLPPSIHHLLTRSDAWTDEIHEFYFEIAPRDFPALLPGREFRDVSFPGPIEIRTLQPSPPASLVARWRYRWEVEGAHCEVQANEAKSRVTVVYSAD